VGPIWFSDFGAAAGWVFDIVKIIVETFRWNVSFFSVA
jgi:hypothetical protein